MSYRHSSRSYRLQAAPRHSQLHATPLASFRARAIAFALDGLLLTLLAALPLLTKLVFVGHPAGPKLEITLGGSYYFACFVAYFSLATYLGKGATPGKRLMGIRAVSLAHDHLSLWHCIERALGYSASCLEAGLGFAQYFSHPNHQTVHDRIAETVVVVAQPRQAAGTQPCPTPGEAPPSGAAS